MANVDLSKIPYTPWLEQTLQELVSFPVEGICIHAVGKDGALYSNYYEISVADKLVIAGYIQQDAMMDTLRINGLIAEVDDDGSVEEEDDG